MLDGQFVFQPNRFEIFGIACYIVGHAEEIRQVAFVLLTQPAVVYRILAEAGCIPGWTAS